MWNIPVFSNKNIFLWTKKTHARLPFATNLTQNTTNNLHHLYDVVGNMGRILSYHTHIQKKKKPHAVFPNKIFFYHMFL